MKRLAALMMAGFLLLCCLPAQAADYTVDEKFFRQMEQNAVKGSLVFSVSGKAPEGMDEAVWGFLMDSLNPLTLQFKHSKIRGEGEARAELLLNGEQKADLVYLYNDTLAAYGGSLIAGEDAWYAVPADWNLLRLFLGDRGNDLFGALLQWGLKASAAPADWREKAEAKADEYLNKLGLFVNSFSQPQTGSQEGVLYSELSCALAPEDVKAEIMLLLESFYEDEEFLLILREIASPEEAALLFNPALLPAFREAIGSILLDGQVQIIRRYDVMGHALLDSITLPFSKGEKLASLTLSSSDTGKEKRFAVAGTLPDGNTFDYSFGVDEQGRAAIRLHSGGETKGASTITFDWHEEEETYSLQNDLCERAMQGTLMLTGEDGTEMTLGLDVRFSSKSDKRSPTTLAAALTWQDAKTDAALSATLTLTTAAAWAAQPIDALPAPVRLDQMDEEGGSAAKQAILSRLQETLQSLFPQAQNAQENLLQNQ